MHGTLLYNDIPRGNALTRTRKWIPSLYIQQFCRSNIIAIQPATKTTGVEFPALGPGFPSSAVLLFFSIISFRQCLYEPCKAYAKLLQVNPHEKDNKIRINIVLLLIGRCQLQ